MVRIDKTSDKANFVVQVRDEITEESRAFSIYPSSKTFTLEYLKTQLEYFLRNLKEPEKELELEK